MEIQKNSRQIPRSRKVVSDKNYFDLVYAWFQFNSQVDADGNRYLPKTAASYSKIGEECSIDRRVAGKYVKRLVELDLLEFNEGKKIYILKKLEPCAATLVPQPVLRQLINALNRNAVSIYGYLIDKFVGEKEKSFQETFFHLKEVVGLSLKTRSNDIVIKDILDILKRLGLIDYEIIQAEFEKKILWIKFVNNVLK